MTEYRKAKGLTALEGVEQECLMRWVKLVSGKYPDLEMLYHCYYALSLFYSNLFDLKSR